MDFVQEKPEYVSNTEHKTFQQGKCTHKCDVVVKIKGFKTRLCQNMLSKTEENEVWRNKFDTANASKVV